MRLLWAKHAVTSLLVNRLTGRIVTSIWRDYIPHYSFRIQTSATTISPKMKAKLLMRLYERAEIRFIRSHLRPDLDTLELGSGIGVTARHILTRIDSRSRLICVEANPALIPLLSANLEFAANAILRNVAIAACDSELGRFDVGETFITGQLTEDMKAETPPITPTCLSHLLAEHEVERYALVSDIEGAEAHFILDEPGALRGCEQLIIELHYSEQGGRSTSIEELKTALIKQHAFVLVEEHGPVMVFQKQVPVPSRSGDV